MIGSIITTLINNFTRQQEKKAVSIPNLGDFEEKVIVKDDTFNLVKNGEIRKEYYENNNRVAYVQYRLQSGQIGFLWVLHKYDINILGEQLLNRAFDDIMEKGKATEIWSATFFKEDFWDNVWNKSFTFKEPVHPTVTGGGYYFKFS